MKTPKANPAIIGVFIAGATVILFASVVLFGSGRFFRKTRDMLLTFREPVTGLDAGAPVKLMGIAIGSVKSVALETSEDPTNALMSTVIIEIDRDQCRSVFRDYPVNLDDRVAFGRLVEEKGLRAQLETLSMVSGQIYIGLGLYPDRPGYQLNREADHGYWEIPTLPSTKRQLVESVVTSLENLSRMDFEGNSRELKGLLTDLRADLENLQLGQIGTNLNLTLSQLEHLSETLNAKIEPFLTQAEADLKKAGVTLDEATKALHTVQTQVEPGAPLSRELIRTLEEASAALNAIRQLAQELQRNPNALITGKEQPKP